MIPTAIIPLMTILNLLEQGCKWGKLTPSTTRSTQFVDILLILTLGNWITLPSVIVHPKAWWLSFLRQIEEKFMWSYFYFKFAKKPIHIDFGIHICNRYVLSRTWSSCILMKMGESITLLNSLGAIKKSWPWLKSNLAIPKSSTAF